MQHHSYHKWTQGATDMYEPRWYHAVTKTVATYWA